MMVSWKGLASVGAPVGLLAAGVAIAGSSIRHPNGNTAWDGVVGLGRAGG